MLFYSTFQTKLFENWHEWRNRPNESGDIQCAPGPKLWKVLGDELIFWKECWHPREVLGIIQVWRKTVLDFKNSWQFPDLRIKSGSWLVGSPVGNWEIAFLRSAEESSDSLYSNNPVAYNFHLLKEYYSEEDRRKINLDFVGPNMDCGFRLLAHSDERRFVLSADLVDILCSEVTWWERQSYVREYPEIKFFYDGVVTLKGISRYGVDYPLIWLDSFADASSTDASTFASARDEIEERKPKNPHDLQRFVTKFLHDMGGFPSRPYICRISADGTVNNTYSALPEQDAGQVESLRSAYLTNIKNEEEVRDAFEHQDGIGSDPVDIADLADKIKPA